MVRIALFQSQSGITPSANADQLEDAIRQAASGGAAMLFTPEMSGMLDRDRDRALGNTADEPDDEVLRRVADAARQAGIWVHLGSLALKGRGNDGRLVNRGFVIAPDGSVKGRYDKIHLFDVDLPTGESWRESALYAPGETLTLVRDTPVGALGLAICYDLRFAEQFAALAMAGADVVAVPAAFTVPTGRAHWEILLRARAIENAMFIVAAAQCGTHEDGRVTYGHSLVIDPWGEVLLDMGETLGVSFAEIDLQRVADVRARIPVHAHRRPIAPPGAS